MTGCRASTGKADTEHEGKGFFLSFFLQDIPYIAVILYIEAVKLRELVTLFTDISCGGIGEIGGDVPAQVVR